jgi:hypothetical protein
VDTRRGPERGSVLRRKAPRVLRIALPFAGVRGRRPYKAPLAERWVVPGELETGSSEPIGRSASPARMATRERQEVSGPIGLGQSSHRERSRREVPMHRGETPKVQGPLTRELSAGCNPVRGGRHPHPERVDRQADSRRSGCCSGRPLQRSCGVRRSVVVLANRIDGRSRQAACGPRALAGEESAGPLRGLVFSRESGERTKERRKPDRWWQSPETGGGFPQNPE